MLSWTVSHSKAIWPLLRANQVSHLLNYTWLEACQCLFSSGVNFSNPIILLMSWWLFSFHVNLLYEFDKCYCHLCRAENYNTSAIEFLRRLPGVTDANYRAIMDGCGSLAELALLPVERLAELMGGQKAARTLRDFLDAKYPTLLWG